MGRRSLSTSFIKSLRYYGVVRPAARQVERGIHSVPGKVWRASLFGKAQRHLQVKAALALRSRKQAQRSAFQASAARVAEAKIASKRALTTAKQVAAKTMKLAPHVAATYRPTSPALIMARRNASAAARTRSVHLKTRAGLGSLQLTKKTKTGVFNRALLAQDLRNKRAGRVGPALGGPTSHKPAAPSRPAATRAQIDAQRMKILNRNFPRK
jgi:hypothetical protein